MTSHVGEWPLPSVVPLTSLGPLGPPVSTDDGQSRKVSPLERYDGWLAKLYRSPVGDAGTARLDALLALPGAVSEGDRQLIRSTTSWPVARITAGLNETVGCVIPRAPANFHVRLQASATRAVHKYLDVDWLAMSDATLVGRSIRVPSNAERLRVCRNVIAVAACLERHRIVYSDWSYSNTFWDPLEHSVFVIDVDGCGRDSIPNIFQPNWDDPLTPRSARADGCTDRFRVALLVARCLTGKREWLATLRAVGGLRDRLGNQDLPEVLLDMLLAKERRHRPTLDTLLAVANGRSYQRMRIERIALPPLAAAGSAADRTATGDGKETAYGGGTRAEAGASACAAAGSGGQGGPPGQMPEKDREGVREAGGAPAGASSAPQPESTGLSGAAVTVLVVLGVIVLVILTVVRQ